MIPGRFVHLSFISNIISIVCCKCHKLLISTWLVDARGGNCIAAIFFLVLSDRQSKATHRTVFLYSFCCIFIQVLFDRYMVCEKLATTVFAETLGRFQQTARKPTVLFTHFHRKRKPRDMYHHKVKTVCTLFGAFFPPILTTVRTWLQMIFSCSRTWSSFWAARARVMTKWRRLLKTGSVGWLQISAMQPYRNSSHDTSAWIFMGIV